MTDVFEQQRDFIQRHGGAEAGVRIRSAIVFPDGAIMIEGATGIPPELREPPEEPAHRLRIRRDYYQTKLAQAEQHFHEAKDLRNLAVAKHWAAIVTRLRREFVKVDREFEALPEVQAQREEEQRQKETQAATEADRVRHLRSLERELDALEI